jgi:hypothetical protein
VKTLGYEIVGTMSQKRDAIDGGTVLGKGRLAELAAITGGTLLGGRYGTKPYCTALPAGLTAVIRRMLARWFSIAAAHCTARRM